MKAPQSSTNKRCSAAFTLLELILVIAIITILIGLLSVGLMGARRQAARRATQGRIAQFEMAVQRFYDEFRVYPPDQWGDKNDTPPADGTMMKFLVDHGYDASDDGGLSTEIDDPQPDATYQDIECLVYAVTVVRHFLELKMAERSNREATPDTIDWLNADAMDSPAYEICDAWNKPLHYVAEADIGTITLPLDPGSLTDSSKNWTPNEWVDWKVAVGQQVRTVTNNGSDTLTVSPDWSPEPMVGWPYKILPLHNPGFVDIWSDGPDRDSSAAGSGSPEDADNVTNWERD